MEWLLNIGIPVWAVVVIFFVVMVVIYPLGINIYKRNMVLSIICFIIVGVVFNSYATSVLKDTGMEFVGIILTAGIILVGLGQGLKQEKGKNG